MVTIEDDSKHLGSISMISSLFKGAKSFDIASGTTTDLNTLTGNFVHITGAATISSFGVVQAGVNVFIIFDGTLTIKHNSTSLVLPDLMDIVTSAGDRAVMMSEGSGNWVMLYYTKVGGITTPAQLTSNQNNYNPIGLAGAKILRLSTTNTNITGQGVTDYNTARASLVAIAATNTTHAAVFGNGETVLAGVYSIVGAGSASGNLTLDAQGNVNALFIFRFGAAFSTGAGATIILTNGASASNIYWCSEGAISLGASTTMKGTLFARNGAVSLGATCNLQGRMLTNLGAVGIDTSVVNAPTSSYIALGVLTTFAMFSSSGNITNSGVSNVTGDIGTNSGTITGFGTAVVTGTTYLPGVDTSIDISGLMPFINVLKIFNVGDFDMRLLNESANSNPNNRFSLGGNFTLASKVGVQLYYDTVSLRWRRY